MTLFIVQYCTIPPKLAKQKITLPWECVVFSWLILYLAYRICLIDERTKMINIFGDLLFLCIIYVFVQYLCVLCGLCWFKLIGFLVIIVSLYCCTSAFINVQQFIRIALTRSIKSQQQQHRFANIQQFWFHFSCDTLYCCRSG